MLDIERDITLLESILNDWKNVIGPDYLGYRNHVYRMVNFSLALKPCSDEEREKVIIAGAFHDIGIWIEDTVDYIPPSIPPAMDYLKCRGLESWSEEIRLMIEEHHKIREFKDDASPLVELFRRGDLVDFSLGLFKFGLQKTYIDQVKAAFPNEGFHRSLLKRAGKWLLKHPLRPLPMMKW
ncbi:MAG: hypothetical protein ABW109_22170 [Candidatus Thiodiazotropha sp. 6PLUC4]